MLTEGTYTVLARADRAPDAEIVARFGGMAIDDRTVAFRSAIKAVECAIALAEQAPGAIALHAGELGAGDQGEARPVVLTVRLATIAREDQVLASSVVRALAPDARMGEARDVSLPGLVGRMTVHDVHLGRRRRDALRVVIADDAALVRDGVAALLRDNGVEVAATAADAAELHEAVARHLPDVALVDIRMPPTYTDERIAAGGCVIDQAVAEGLVSRASALARIDELTEREREVLALVAEGLTNRAIAERLVVTQKTVETHIGQIFLKLGLRDVEDEDRRVAA